MGLLRQVASVASSSGTSSIATTLPPSVNFTYSTFCSRLISCADFNGHPWQHNGSRGASCPNSGSRSFSSAPVDEGRWDSDPAFPSAQPAAADAPSADPGMDLQAITDAIGAAEFDSILAAGEAGWAPTRLIINSLSSLHDMLGTGW